MNHSDSAPDKAALRKALRRIRRDIPSDIRKMAGPALLRQALSHRLLSGKHRLGFYIPAKNEIDCLPLLKRAQALGAECYLPVVPGPRQRRLGFSRLGEAALWRHNRYGIAEYGHRATRRVRAFQLDILFMPLLGFDVHGYRMGMGGGYYDASLAYLARRRHWRTPRLIGLAFEAQKVAGMLPTDPWDIPLDAIITERRYYRFSSAGARPHPG